VRAIFSNKGKIDCLGKSKFLHKTKPQLIVFFQTFPTVFDFFPKFSPNFQDFPLKVAATLTNLQQTILCSESDETGSQRSVCKSINATERRHMYKSQPGANGAAKLSTVGGPGCTITDGGGGIELSSLPPADLTEHTEH